MKFERVRFFTQLRCRGCGLVFVGSERLVVCPTGCALTQLDADARFSRVIYMRVLVVVPAQLLKRARGSLAMLADDLHRRHRSSAMIPIERCAAVQCREAREILREIAAALGDLDTAI